MTKAQLAEMLNVSRATLTRYLKMIEDQIPHYRRSQRIFTPLQVEFLRQHFGI